MIDKRKDIEGAKAGSKPRKPYIQKDTVASTQTAEIVYGIGEGENAGLISGLQSIILDGTRVIGANGEVNYNEVKYEERVGLIEQEPLKLIEDTATERTLNLEVTSANPIVATFNNSDVDKFVVRMSIPQLMQNKDNGDSVATSVSYAIDIAVDGGPFVEVITHTVREKITNGYEIEHELDTPEGSVRLVRVRRVTGDSTSQMIANKTYVAGIVEIITAKFTHPALHYVGLTFNAENFNGIPKAVFHYKGRKIQIPTNYNPETRTYTGIWDGTFKVMYSNNPAWVLYDMLTHRRFGLGRRIPNELVDKWELYRIGAYCDEMVPDGKGGMEPRFVCNNLVLNSKEDAYKVIKDMASIFRGQAFWNGTQVITSADIPRDVEYAISMASVKDYSYSGTSRAARHNVIKVQYYDKANEYKAAYEFATDYDSIRELGEINELEIRAFGCDSPGQAQRLARYTLLSEQTETRILTATIALDGMVNMQIGDIFAWSDRLLAGAENGGRVVAVNGKEVTLDRDVTSSALIGDTLYVNTADGKAAIREITAVAGNKITVDQELPNVEQEFVWVIDSEQLSLLFFRLDSVRVSPVDNVVEITGTQHVNSKFAAVDTETALEAPPFSKIEIDTLRAPENVTLTYNVRVDQGINIADLYVAWGQVKGATRYTVEFRRDQQPWRTLGVVTGLTHTIENVSSGVYEVRVRATDALGNISPFGFSAALNVDGMVLPPPALTSFTAIGELLAIRAKWSFPEGAEASLATVIEYTNQDPNVAGFTSQTMNVTYPQTEYVFNGLGAHTQLWMRGGLMDKYGQVGEMTGWVSAVADANPEQLIDLISGHINEGTLDQVLKEKIDGAVADADSAGVLAASAASLANDAKTAAANAQTTADDAGTAAANAQATATNAANAVAKEVTDRVAAVTAEANARAAALTKEATDRTAAINKEATDRATALASQATTLKADSAAKVKALKDEVDPKITSLQNGITQVTTDYKAGDTAVVGQLNAYKTSNDSAVASVLQKAESAVATGATNSSAITAINGQITTINNTKLDASVINGYYTKGQTDAKAAEIAAGKVEEFNASLVIGGTNLIDIADVQTLALSGTIVSGANYRGFSLPVKAGEVYSISRPAIESNRLRYVFTEVEPASGVAFFGGTGNSTTYDNALKIENIAVPEGAQYLFVYMSNQGETITKLKVERGSKASDWSESPVAVENKLNANSTAIQDTNAEVARVDGVATAANNATTALAGRVSTVEGQVATKAEAAALTALTTRVTEAEGVNTSQGSAITTLQNTVNHSTTGLATKASTSALTAVDNKVAAANGRIDTTNSNVTALQGRVDTVEGAVATKAEAAALTALTTRVGNTESTNTSQGTAITTLQNTVNHSTTGLATKASTAALTATNSEVTRIDGVVSGHTSQLTQLTSDITAINGTLVTKADASALNDIYTKTQTDDKATEIAVGEISKYDASLVIGGVNQLLDSEGERSSTATTRREYLLYEKSTHLKDFYEENLNKDVTISFDLKVAVAGSMTVYSSNGSFHSFSTGVNVTADNVDKWVRYSVTVKPTRHGSNTASTVSTLEFYGTYDTGRIPYVRKVQLEAGNKATDWSPSPRDTQAALDANATAIDDTNSEVTRVDGRVTTEANRITSLSGRVSTVEGQVATKAEAAALSSLTTRVTEAEGVNTSQGSAITNLQNTVNHATTGLATKASSAALTAVDNRVTTVDGRVTTTNSNLTLLTGRVSTVEGALTTKADVAALNDIYTKSETDDKATEIAAGEISKYDASLSIGIDNLLPTQIDLWENGYWDMASGVPASGSAYSRTKADVKIPVVAGEKYSLRSNTRTVIVFYSAENTRTGHHESGTSTPPTTAQVITVPANTAYARAYLFGASGVVAKPTPFDQAALTALQGMLVRGEHTKLVWQPSALGSSSQIDANASAIDTLTSEVSRVDGRVTTESNRITTLTGRVSTVEGSKADVSALNALTTRVSDAEGGLATQVTATTNLTTSLAATDKIAKDALPQISSFSSYKLFRNVLNYYYASSGTALALVIQTPITFSAKMFKVTVTGYNYSINRSNINLEVSGYAYSGSTILNHGAINHGTFPLSVKLGVRDSKLVIILLRTVQNWAYPQFNVDAEIGYTSSPDTWKDGWSVTPMAEADFATNGITAIITPTTKDVPTEVEANASAISTLTSDVSDIEGTVTSQGTAITNLENSVNSPTTGLATKASAQALTTLNNQVQHSTTGLSAVNTKVDNLKATVESPTTGLATKATAQALTTLNNQVQHSTTGLSAVNSKVDTLKATVENTTTGLPSKASSSALNTLSNKVNHSTTGLDAIANKTTVLESDVSKALDVITIRDTRSTNELPGFYWNNYGNRRVNEFKYQTAIGVSSFFGGTYCNLETVVYWSNSSGGPIIQTATSGDDPSLYVQRQSSGSGDSAVWTAWAQPIKDLRDDMAGKASASALNSLTTRVTTAEGKISTEATKLSNLSTTVGGHTTTINSHTSSINGIRGVHALKIETNGVISGYGLVSELVNGQVKSQFGINADSFFIGAPSNNKKPFTVLTSPGTINGVTVPAGTYIDTAFIPNATITSAKIADLAVTTAKIGNGQITTAKIGDLQVDTLKIKDNAVTVPIGVKLANKTYSARDIQNAMNAYAEAQGWIVWQDGVGRWPYPDTLAETISLYETVTDPVFSVVVPRAGGKCRIDFSVMVSNNGRTFNAVGPGNQPESVLREVRLFLSLYRGTTLIGRTTLAPTSFIGTTAGYAGNMALMALDDTPITGNVTYTVKLSFGYIGGVSGIRVANFDGILTFEQIVGSALELKK